MRVKRNSKKFTKKVKLKNTETVKIQYSTRGEIYEVALENFAKKFPLLKARKVIATKMGIGESMLSMIINDERELSASKQDMFFRETYFPQGYDYLRQLNFLNREEEEEEEI